MNRLQKWWLPVAIVIFLLIFIGQNLGKYTQVVNDVHQITGDVAELKGRIVGRSPEGWHRKDMEQWCEEAIKQNPDFRCPKITNND